MFSLNSATSTHFLQKQWEKDKHGKLWHLAKGCNLELSVCLYYFYNKWHLHSSLAFLYAHSFDSSIPGLQQSSNKQNNRYKSTQRWNQVDLKVNLTPPAGCLNHLSCSGHNLLSPVLGPFSFPSKNPTDKKNSSLMQMGKKLPWGIRVKD